MKEYKIIEAWTEEKINSIVNAFAADYWVLTGPVQVTSVQVTSYVFVATLEREIK